MPTHWSVTDNAPACNRSQTHWRTVTCPAEEYLAARQYDPERYCSRCAKLCKLSMQGSHALRSIETRTDSDRYAELRKLVEAYQSAKSYDDDVPLQALRDWSHR